MDWLKLDHETPTDMRLAMLGREANLRRCEVTAIWECLLIHASKHKHRGTVGDFDAKVCAFSQEISHDGVLQFYANLIEDGVIKDGKLANWSKYQRIDSSRPDSLTRPMTAAERKAKQRGRAKEIENGVIPNMSHNVTNSHDMSHDVTLTPDKMSQGNVTSGGDYRGGDLDSDSEKKEAKASSSPKPKSAPVMFDFETGDFSGISETRIEKWKAAYPAINVQQEITKSAEWLIANPKNRKSNYPKFINGWLCRAQDKAPTEGARNGKYGYSNQPSKFNVGIDGFAAARIEREQREQEEAGRASCGELHHPEDVR